MTARLVYIPTDSPAKRTVIDGKKRMCLVCSHLDDFPRLHPHFDKFLLFFDAQSNSFDSSQSRQIFSYTIQKLPFVGIQSSSVTVADERLGTAECLAKLHVVEEIRLV